MSYFSFSLRSLLFGIMVASVLLYLNFRSKPPVEFEDVKIMDNGVEHFTKKYRFEGKGWPYSSDHGFFVVQDKIGYVNLDFEYYGDDASKSTGTVVIETPKSLSEIPEILKTKIVNWPEPSKKYYVYNILISVSIVLAFICLSSRLLDRKR